MNDAEKKIAEQLLARITKGNDSQAITDYREFIEATATRIAMEKALRAD